MIRTFVNPFEAEGEWFKGNIHTHSTISDGTRTPPKLVEIYKKAGYDFLSITDHSVVTDIENLEDRGILLIPGEEICVGRSNANTFYHIVGLGIKSTLPYTDFDPDVDPQFVINHINELDGISVIAHPYWSGLDHQDLIKLKNYHGVEIYNTSCDYERNTGLSASHIDSLIAAGRRPLIYAVDDHHGAFRPLLPLDACNAWINVKAKSGKLMDIMSSINEGLFYSSTGPVIHSLVIDENDFIHIKCSPVKYISFVSTPSLGIKFHAKNKPLTEAIYPGRAGETYIRIEITDYEGRTAWSNPIYNET